MNLIKKFINWLLPKEPAYYYRLNSETDNVEKVTPAAPEPKVEEVPDEEVDVPLFTIDELEEMKKNDLLELATDSGITDVTKKDTKKILIEKIVSHYQIQK
jgi:hypothetical protein